MKRIAAFAWLVLMAAAAWSQAPVATASADANPVAHAREAMPWHYGPFVNYGVGLGDRSDYKFLSGGVELGKNLTPVIKAGPLSGQFELAGNVMPLWQAYTPAPHTQVEVKNGLSYQVKYGGGTFRGVSVTPVIMPSASPSATIQAPNTLRS